MIDKLVKPKATRPGTVKTLRNALKAQFRMQADDQMLDELIEHLTKSEVLKIVDGKVHYELP